MLNVFKSDKNRNKGSKKDEVYEFFVNSKSDVRRRAYGRALREAQKDQMSVMKRAELMK